MVESLTTHTHITKGAIGVFFRKNVRYAFCCFQNIVVFILNSTNSIDKVKFNIMKTKFFLNFILKG
ncbi:hypothetical protein GCM10011518_35420 [Flavobacterium limi]|uniref:Uncharacterized protein n=1 Tax=Flavobacterium limi TaxID=2045105 RepID=A0ABQ1URD2_9FLAO|nr:hypothetical protein GCM10011518_35420 [Flavobacterium limi]